MRAAGLPASCLLVAVSACGQSPTAPEPGAPPSGYTRLSETGLFADLPSKRLAEDLIAFEPSHVLWSDGARKRRWIRLPAGMQIDTADMDRWRFPVGTQAFKEFSLDGVLLETRLIQRTGAGEDDFWMGAFVWLPDGSDAVLAADGRADVNGTGHDVPSVADCHECHRGEPGGLLGFSAVQLSHPGPGTTLASLAAQGRLSRPPPAGASFAAPGDPVTARALGYLHANCGHCHNPQGSAWAQTDMHLRLDVNARRPEETPAYRTAVGRTLQSYLIDPFVFRVRPGFPEESAVWHRMARRDREQMPPLATEVVDEAGLGAVGEWIRGLR